MRNRRSLIAANIIAVSVLVAVLVAGWWDTAGFGLAVLVLLDLLVLVRERAARSSKDRES